MCVHTYTTKAENCLWPSTMPQRQKQKAVKVNSTTAGNLTLAISGITA